MGIRRFVAAAVIAAFGTSDSSSAAWAGESPTAVAAPHVSFEKAIARAVEQSSAIRSGETARPGHTKQTAMQRGYGGGGGGHMMMVMSLVGTVAGVGMTYYMIKQMQKATGEASQPALRGEK
jgi:hypothetical protein